MNWQECVPYFCLSEYDCKVYTVGPNERCGSVFYEFYDDDIKVATSQLSYNFDENIYGVDFIYVHEDYRGKQIGKRMAAAYYDVALFVGAEAEKIRTTTKTDLETFGDKNWINGPEVDLLDPNDPYVVWQKQFRESQNSN